MDIRSWADSGRFLLSLECPDRCGYLDPNDDVINVAVSVFFHAWSPCTDPPSKGWELDWIRLMATTYSKLRQFLLHIFTNDTCLNACKHVGLINPFNFVHPCAIDWNDRPFLLLSAHKALCDIGSSFIKQRNTLQKESVRHCVPWPWGLSVMPAHDMWYKLHNPQFSEA